MNKEYNLILDNTFLDFALIKQLDILKYKYPQAFYENQRSLSLFFTFPYTIWSKGHRNEPFMPYENIENELSWLRNKKIKIFYEFENTNVKPNHFNDRYSNIVLDITKKNELFAVVQNLQLANYLKEQYPNITLVESSINKSIKINNPFEMCMIDYRTLRQCKNEITEKEKYIVMLNSFCDNTYRCVNLTSNSHLNYEIERPLHCVHRVDKFLDSKMNNNFISIENLQNLVEDGFVHFFVKSDIPNRFEKIETYVYYLIKPEFQDVVKLELVKEFFN
jgi:hypothetical protein